jgi:hypothetical protein
MASLESIIDDLAEKYDLPHKELADQLEEELIGGDAA